MFEAPVHDTLVPFDVPFDLRLAQTVVPERPSEGKLKDDLKRHRHRLDDLQRRLYADRRWALLVVFQGRDASGKDGTIRSVFRRTDPAGVQVTSFRAPSEVERAHDFLWRTTQRLPERGEIGVFNRSYYEEVLIAQVHPELLVPQGLPDGPEAGEVPSPAFWQERYESILDHERHLARNGVVIVKCFLNVSAEEQRDRFLARLDDPEKHWKFHEDDIRDRDRWHDYTEAYQSAIGATSRPWAPWYVVPADDKDHMRVMVAEILVASLESLDLQEPQPSFERPLDELRALVKKSDIDT